MMIEPTEYESILAALSDHFPRSSYTCFLEVLCPQGDRRIDLLAIGNGHQSGSRSVAVEIKRSRADFKSEIADRNKRRPWEGLADQCYFCVPGKLVSKDEVPSGWGLLSVVRGKVHVVKVAKHRDGADLRTIRNLARGSKPLNIRSAESALADTAEHLSPGEIALQAAYSLGLSESEAVEALARAVNAKCRMVRDSTRVQGSESHKVILEKSVYDNVVAICTEHGDSPIPWMSDAVTARVHAWITGYGYRRKTDNTARFGLGDGFAEAWALLRSQRQDRDFRHRKEATND